MLTNSFTYCIFLFWLSVMDMTFLMQVVGGVPLLKLVAVDWLKVGKAADKIALHHRSLVKVKYDIIIFYIFNIHVGCYELKLE